MLCYRRTEMGEGGPGWSRGCGPNQRRLLFTLSPVELKPSKHRERLMQEREKQKTTTQPRGELNQNHCTERKSNLHRLFAPMYKSGR